MKCYRKVCVTASTCPFTPQMFTTAPSRVVSQDPGTQSRTTWLTAASQDLISRSLEGRSAAQH